ncbi:hypothetical protein GCM10010915_15060 [Microbacterium faecale]|uniref:Uncharacterized protein n=1 Tax=Microbacterium faecale TaxID=1804630 RepID=A0A916Y9Q5_9MICO|nr:hypothetical protein [Microbacterium faecale]GGD35508.1 hypothetical protein GCM10010915_15060 [Microbacterium faecale]
MAHDEAELAELRRRAYGRGADLAGDPAAMARLVELEDAQRPVVEDPRAMAERDAPGSAREDPADGAAGEYPRVSEQPSGRGSAQARGGGDEMGRDGARVRSRWFSPALVVTCGLAAIIVMLAAGGVGWAGGFVAGWAGAAAPDAEGWQFEGMHEAQAVPDATADQPWTQMLVDARTGEASNETAYFGEFGDGTHITVTTGAWGSEVESASDQACVQLFRVAQDDADGTSTWGTGACGSTRADVRFDVIVAETDPGPGSRIAVDGYEPGTVLRFVYEAEVETIEVWSLPPEEEPDP